MLRQQPAGVEQEPKLADIEVSANASLDVGDHVGHVLGPVFPLADPGDGRGLIGQARFLQGLLAEPQALKPSCMRSIAPVLQ